jgi:hypothetical protein
MLLVTAAGPSSSHANANANIDAIRLLEARDKNDATAERFAAACGGEIRAVLLGTARCYLALHAVADGGGGEEEGEEGGERLLSSLSLAAPDDGDGKKEEEEEEEETAAAAADVANEEQHHAAVSTRYVHKYTRRDPSLKRDVGCVCGVHACVHGVNGCVSLTTFGGACVCADCVRACQWVCVNPHQLKPPRLQAMASHPTHPARGADPPSEIQRRQGRGCLVPVVGGA